ncbi:hypothetical protein BH23VER1_BH23VER1_37400 [soil metagenome]
MADQHPLAFGLEKVASTEGPDAMLTLLTRMSPGDDRRSLSQSLTRRLATTAGSDILESHLLPWARALPSSQSPFVEAAIAVGLARHSPTRAADILRGIEPHPSGALGSQWSDIAFEWGDNDPQGASAYFSANSNAIPASAFRTLAYRWLENDPAAASIWVSQMPRSDRKDAAIGSIIGHLTGRSADAADFQTALAWSAEIVDPAQASKAAESTLIRWRKTDPNTAPKLP